MITSITEHDLQIADTASEAGAPARRARGRNGDSTALVPQEPDAAVALQGLSVDHAERALNDIGGTYNIGIVKIALSVDLEVPEVRARLSVMGIAATTIVLNRARAGVSVPINVGLAKATIGLSVDFDQTLIRYDIKACVRSFTGWRCKQYRGVLFNW